MGKIWDFQCKIYGEVSRTKIVNDMLMKACIPDRPLVANEEDNQPFELTLVLQIAMLPPTNWKGLLQVQEMAAQQRFNNNKVRAGSVQCKLNP